MMADLSSTYEALQQVAYPLISALSLATSRALGMVMVMPVFNRLGLTGLVRNAVAVALSLPLIPTVFIALKQHEALGIFTLVSLMMKEMVIGVAFGLLVGIPIWAAETAGEFIDLQRGSTQSQLYDPSQSGQSGVTATLMSILITMMFFASGGFLIVIGGFYKSYDMWPVIEFTPPLSQAAALYVVNLLDQTMRIAVVMIAPLLVIVMIAELSLAYLARMSPNLHVFDLSMSVKNLAFVFFFFVYFIFLIPQLQQQLDGLSSLISFLPSLFSSGGGHG